jgi:hypothetical protein
MERLVRVGNLYSITALYLYFIADRIARQFCPWKPSLVFYPLLIGLSPCILLLIGMSTLKGI